MSSFSSFHSTLTPKQYSRDLEVGSESEYQDADVPPPVPSKDLAASVRSNSFSSTTSSIDQSYHHHHSQFQYHNHQQQQDPNAYQASMLPPSQQSTIRGNLSRPTSAMIELENSRSLGLDSNRDGRQREDSSSTTADNFFSPKMWPSTGAVFAPTFDSNQQQIDSENYYETATTSSRRHRPSLPDHFVDAEQSQPQSNHLEQPSEEDGSRLSAGGIFGSSRSRTSSGHVRSRTGSQASSRSRSGNELNSPSPAASHGNPINITTNDLPDPSTFPLPPSSNPSSAQVSPSTSKNGHLHYSSDMSQRHSGSTSTRGSTWTERSLASSRTSASAASERSMNSPNKPSERSSSYVDDDSTRVEGEGQAQARYDADDQTADVNALAVGLGISSDREEAYGVKRSRTVTAGSVDASELSSVPHLDGPFAHHRQPSWTRRQEGIATSMIMTSGSSADQPSSTNPERPTLARLQSEMTLDTYQQQQQHFKTSRLPHERNPSVGAESIISNSTSSQDHGSVFIPPRTESRSRKSSTRGHKLVTKATSPTPSEIGSGIERIQSPSRSSSLKKPSKKSSSSKLKSIDTSSSSRPNLSLSASLRSHTSSPSLSSSPTSPSTSVLRGRSESLSHLGSAFDILLSSDGPDSPSSELGEEEVMRSSPQLHSETPPTARRGANIREGGAHPLSIDTTGAEDRNQMRSRNTSVSSVADSVRMNSTASSSPNSSRNGSLAHGAFRRGGTVRSRGDSISGIHSFMLPTSSDDEDGDSNSHFGYVESYLAANPDESDDAEALRTVLDGSGVVIESSGRPLSEVEREVGPDTTHLVLGGCASSEMPFFLERILPLISHSLLALDLSNAGLRTVPSAISLCNSLEELNLSSNPFQFSSSNAKPGDQTLPSWLGTLPSLRVLVLDDLNIESLPKSFQSLTELKTLSIMKNGFTHLPSWLHHCNKLERICLDDNKFQGAWIKILAPLLPNLPRPEEKLQPIETRGRGGSLSAPSNSTNFDLQNAPPMPGYESKSSEALSASTSTSSFADSIGRSGGGLRPLMRRMQSAGDLKKNQAASSPPNDEMPTPGGMTRASASYNDALSQAQDIPQAMPDFSRSNSSSPSASRTDLKSSQGPEDGNPDTKWGFLRKKMGRKSSSNRIYTLAGEGGDGKSSRPSSRPGSSRGMIAETFGLSSNPNSQDSRGPGAAPLTPMTPGFPRSQSSASSLTAVSGGSLGISDKQSKRRSFLPVQTSLPPSANSTASSFVSEPQDLEVHQRRLRALLHYLRDLDDLGPTLANSRIGPAGFDPPSPHDSSAALRRQQSFGVLIASNGLSALSKSNDNAIGGGVESSAKSIASRSSAGQGSQADSSNVTSPNTTPNSSSNDSHQPSSQSPATPTEYKDNSNRRRLILLEMLSSEESYNKGLSELVEIYVRPALLPLESGSSNPALPPAEHRAVFSNVEGLQKFHKDAFLPSLRHALQPLIDRQEQLGGEVEPEEDAAFTAQIAEEVAKVFTRHSAFFRMYSSYINNCDSAQTRIQAWLMPSVSAAASAFKSAGSSTSGQSASSNDTIGGLTSGQRKKIKAFMKRCRANPRHAQLNVESYLLLPVQRLPRYRLLLEDLVRSTPPSRLKDPEVTSSALGHISRICSSVNESKRQSEQDRRLLFWQSRIRGKWPSPLVQPHRRLVKDGVLTLKRVVKRVPAFLADQSASADDDEEVGDTSDSSLKVKKKVPVDCLQQQSLDLNLVLILCNDLTVTVQDSSNGRDEHAPVDLYAVLRVQASKPVQVIGGTNLRVCDSRSILYFSARSASEAEAWAAAINSQNQD